MKINEIYLGDCLELMPKHVENKSIDMIFCDLPYGTTACKWDTIIPFDELWSEYERVIKDNGAIVLFGSEPFSSDLRMSNIKKYRYDWIWEKTKPIGFGNSNKMPLKSYETVSVFYKNLPTYNPQGLIAIKEKTVTRKSNEQPSVYGKTGLVGSFKRKYTNYPRQILRFPNTNKNQHPTQKPIELIEYMIRTYTNEGDLILDNTCGSGTTGLGAKNLNRNYIMMEQDPKYYEIACKRVQG